MKKRTGISRKIMWIFLAGFLLAAIGGAYRYRHHLGALWAMYGPGSGSSGECRRCAQLFRDGVSTHEKAYRHEGISPKKTLHELEQLEEKGVLIKAEENSHYYLDDMTHSVPLLLPKGIQFLDELGKRYEAQCREKGLDYHPFKVTSMTRSLHSVKDLQKENQVAIKRSPHLLGKTMDISYTAFGGHQSQLNAFVSVLSEMRSEGKCYVKYERTTGCLHITAR